MSTYLRDSSKYALAQQAFHANDERTGQTDSLRIGQTVPPVAAGGLGRGGLSIRAIYATVYASLTAFLG